jgi:hypothetical protein
VLQEFLQVLVAEAAWVVVVETLVLELEAQAAQVNQIL